MRRLRRALPYWPTWLVGLAAVLCLVLLATGCGPSGDPRNPNPFDFGALTPCVASVAADATIAVEVIDREGRLINAPGVIVERDAVSIVGSAGRGGFAIDVPEAKHLPDERSVTAPYCWHVILLPGVTEAIVTITASYPLQPGERLVVYKFERIGGRLGPFGANPQGGNYAEFRAGSAGKYYGRVSIQPHVTLGGNAV